MAYRSAPPCRSFHFDDRHHVAILDLAALRAAELRDHAGPPCAQRVLHLHGLHHSHRLTGRHTLPRRHQHLEHLAGHRRPHQPAVVAVALALRSSRFRHLQLVLTAAVPHVHQQGSARLVSLRHGDRGLRHLPVHLQAQAPVCGQSRVPDVAPPGARGILAAVARQLQDVRAVPGDGHRLLGLAVGVDEAHRVRGAEPVEALGGGVGPRVGLCRLCGRRCGEEASDAGHSDNLPGQALGRGVQVRPVRDDEVGVDAPRQEGRVLQERLHKRDVGGQPSHLQLPQRRGQRRGGRGTVSPVRHDLCDHGVVEGANRVALNDPAVNSNGAAEAEGASTRRNAPPAHGARGWQEVLARVLRVDPCLDGVTMNVEVRLCKGQHEAGRDAQLLLHEVESGDHLRDGVLHLQPGVHLCDTATRQIRCPVMRKQSGVNIRHAECNSGVICAILSRTSAPRAPPSLP
mmetsp:Transcript_32759/g.82529  ORF Transcript_32759/g.82529 Transcript_32759/m.82529 type:complete len:458 (-) Transcript_32759:277-1650(-)